MRTLRYFVATVDEGSETAAARRLHVTQPVLSRALRRWERRLGLTLFERAGRHLRLTTAGAELLGLARDALHRADAVEQTAARLAEGAVTTIHIAAPTTTLTDVLAPYLARLGPHDPLPLVEDLGGDAAAAPEAGVDLVVTPVRPPAHLASVPVARLPVFAYAWADHPWIAERFGGVNPAEVALADLVAQDLIVLDGRFRARALLDRAVDAAGLVVAPALECSTPQVAQALAAAGRGVAVVSDDPRFGLMPMRIRTGGGHVEISLWAAWRPDHHARDVLAAFAAGLAAFATERYAGQSPASWPRA